MCDLPNWTGTTSRGVAYRIIPHLKENSFAQKTIEFCRWQGQKEVVVVIVWGKFLDGSVWSRADCLSVSILTFTGQTDKQTERQNKHCAVCENKRGVTSRSTSRSDDMKSQV